MFGLFGKSRKKGPEYPEVIIARLNARVKPIERGEYFEDPLDRALQAAGLGEVTGGGTQMSAEPDGIEFVDIEIMARDAGVETRSTIRKVLEKAAAPKGSRLLVDGRDDLPFGKYEGMGLFLNGADLPEEVYADSDVNQIIENLGALSGEAGSFRGFWEGSRETALYFYGPSFEEMKSRVEDYLEEDPACALTRVVQIA